MDQKIENDIYSLFKKIDAADRNKGRLTMGSYNMAPFKNDVMKIVDEILEHPQNAQLYEDAKSEWEKLDRMTKGEVMDNPDRYQRSEDEKLRTYIGNSVLQLKKDFDSARGYHFMNDSGFSKIRELKAKIEPYRMSRNYSLDSGLYEQEKGYPKPGVGIKFKDPDLGLKFNELFKSADFSHAGIKYSGTENGNACLILFDNVDADDSDLIGIPRDFCRVVANSIQDYLSDASDYQDYYKTCETIKTLAVQNDYHDAEKIMLNTIYSHRDQPDNPHYLDSKDKDLYKSYVKDRTSINRAAAVSSGSYNQTPNNNAISFMPGVFDGFALLMKSAGRNRAAQETKHEAENFWENERKKEAAERRKEEMEKGYGIDI